MNKSQVSSTGPVRNTLAIFLILSATIWIVLYTISIPDAALAQGEIQCISFGPNETAVANPDPAGPSVAGPVPGPTVVPPETSPPSQEGIGSIQELEKITGENRAIILNNTDVAWPKLTVAKGMEKSQLGDTIPGEQGTILEGQILQNITNLCWQQQ